MREKAVLAEGDEVLGTIHQLMKPKGVTGIAVKFLCAQERMIMIVHGIHFR